ncbi:MAG: serine/threonine-protein kinase [Planctomycetota bacterium]|jgi:serine/threonine protein kinase
MTAGTIMNGKAISHYDLVEKIAEGGMGTVYRGRDQITGQVVAIKVVPKHLLSNQVFLKRFEQEYTAARALDHPNIVRALDFGRDGETPFLVMEFVEGESLGARIEREGAIAEDEAIRIICQSAQGLHKAHKLGLIHRDVKPDNILITNEGQAKVTDLGLVKELEADQNLTRTGRGLGTPHFMAPEQFRNAKKADVRCDIYSLAATLYMMVTGELPFRSLNPLDAWMKKINNDLPAPRKVNPEISERIDWAIRRSMSADPNLRAGSCREFVEDLTGQSTRKVSSDECVEETSEWWYLVYKDEDGVVHTVKGTKQGIRRSLKENLLGDAINIRIAQSKQGPFEPLRQHPEFRDLAIDIDRSGTIPDSMDKTQPRNPVVLAQQAAADPTTKSGPNPLSTSKSGPLKKPVDVPKPANAPGPVFLDIPEDTPYEEAGNEWARYLLFMVAGMALGIVGYFLVLRIFGIRLF